MTTGARRSGSTAQEPELYPENEANAYGVIKDSPAMPTAASPSPRSSTSSPTTRCPPPSRPAGSDDHRPDAGAQRLVRRQDRPGAADSPFRFQLTKIDWTVNAAWYTVVPGKTERDMKKALYTATPTTLNVYSANIGGGLLGWAYFPKGYNNGRDFIDGVVMLDESMPGGTAGKYAQGDTLTHEVGHWLMLEHTFKGACSASR